MDLLLATSVCTKKTGPCQLDKSYLKSFVLFRAFTVFLPDEVLWFALELIELSFAEIPAGLKYLLMQKVGPGSLMLRPVQFGSVSSS